MKFIADLHVHSRFSRATAKNLDFEHLYIAAQIKGITVVATGDFTHPGWFAEIKEKLVPDGSGLFHLRKDLAELCDQKVPGACRSEVRFMLVTEISNIYKKNGKTRKNHNLIFAPDLETVGAFNERLGKIGNIHSDGRPILGLDARNLLELALEISDRCFLVPAHIWTPWFSLLGSKSGFDSLTECFEDLTDQIFAVETGLSSDPAMNLRVSQLDHLTLISNSDAHSPFNLGREANVFACALSYDGIRSAMASGDSQQFLGTYEFYPEEGKYHMDGHRKCQLRLLPEESRKYGGICPVCQKPLTLGVLYRVEELADRDSATSSAKKVDFDSLIPLAEILSELLGVGPKTKKVQRYYDMALATLGPELQILKTFAKEHIDSAGVPLLGEAISRMRAKRVIISSGYDGEYGVIKVFEPDEIDRLKGQQALFQIPGDGASPSSKRPKKKSLHLKVRPADQKKTGDEMPPLDESPKSILSSLNEAQTAAVAHEGGPLLIVAGPGTGKTRTLTHRIAYLIKEKGILPEQILALTFTQKAAREMEERLDGLLHEGGTGAKPFVGTFHALCLSLLRTWASKKAAYQVIDERDRQYMAAEALKLIPSQNDPHPPKRVGPQRLLEMIVLAKQQLLGPLDDLTGVLNSFQVPDTFDFNAVYRNYQTLLEIQGLGDFEDLVRLTVKQLEDNRTLRQACLNQYPYIFVDEYQDLNLGQYRLIQLLTEKNSNLCVIGDPDQSIYGFRGSDLVYFKSFIKDYPGATVVELSQNYRSTETILKAAGQVLKGHSIYPQSQKTYSGIEGTPTISLIEAASEKAEAVAIGKTIERMVGGMGFHSFDYGKVESTSVNRNLSFADFAVLFRTKSQGGVLAEVLAKAGIPYQVVNRDNLFANKGVAFLMSVFRLLNASASFADLERAMRVMDVAIGPKSLEQLVGYAFLNEMTVHALVAGEKSDTSLSKAVRVKLKTLQGRLTEFANAMEGLNLRNRIQYLLANTKLAAILAKDPENQEAMASLMQMAAEYPDGDHDFISQISLAKDPDVYEAKAQKVTLMTMHAAKGLEFPVVFVSGAENGFMPHIRDHKDNVDVDEERRLFYVAMTRAMELLVLTRAKKRVVHGKELERNLTPFITNIEKSLIKTESLQYDPQQIHPALQKYRRKEVQLDLFTS